MSTPVIERQVPREEEAAWLEELARWGHEALYQRELPCDYQGCEEQVAWICDHCKRGFCRRHRDAYSCDQQRYRHRSMHPRG